MDFPLHSFLIGLPWAAAVEVVILVVTWMVARRAGRHSVVDTAWGLMFCAVALSAFASSAGTGDEARRVLLLVMTLLWGVRLAAHIQVRNRNADEDPRYAELLADRGACATVLIVYGGQGALVFVISAPVQVGSFEPAGLGAVAWAGVAVWLIGMLFETVGDAQLRRYASNPDRPPVLDTGLWRYTRHPNYFGDACVWFGVYGVAAASLAGAVTIFAPLLMLYLLVFGSGKRLLERRMTRRPHYRAYKARTSGFFPLPPRRHGD